MAEFEPEIEFDELEHAYSMDGVRIPGLTHVMQKMGTVPGFWFLSKDDLAYYQSRGQAVHKCVELAVKGTLDRRTINKEVRPYVPGIEKFLSEHSVEVLEYEGEAFAERWLIHKVFRYGCRPDLVVRIRGETGVVEVKATSQHSPATGLQTAAQLLAVRHVMPSIGKLRMGLRLLPKEPYYDMKIYEERSDEAVWLSLLNSYNWLTKHKLMRQNGGR